MSARAATGATALARAPLTVGVGVLALVVATGCRPTPPTVAPQPPPAPTDIVVLAVDPDTNAVGRAHVQAQGLTIELTSDMAATRIAVGQPPSAPAPMSAEEFQQRFGPALAARAPQPLYFHLYFERGSDTLVPDSRAMLAKTVEIVGSRPSPNVVVIGHTDTTGDAALNARLGLQRAMLVRDQLIAAGVPMPQIEATSHGEADLLVPTADNVAEARNRRVEITIH